MVAKYRRQVRTGEIGVIRADMSVANSLGQISGAVNKMSNEAFKMAADRAEERGRDYISSKTDDEIFGIDPETGQPKNVMTELLANLPTKGYGMIAQEAIKSEASKRFGIILETKFREQGANAQAKFPLNPGKASAMLEEFTDELASKYEGKYKNKILSYGTQFTSGVRNTLLIRQANNQISISLQNDQIITQNYLNNERSIMETVSDQKTADKMIDEALNPTTDKLKALHETKNNSNTLSGGKTRSANQFKVHHASELGIARIKSVMRKYAPEDLKVVMRMAQVANGAGIDSVQNIEEDDKNIIKKMMKHVVADPEGRSNLYSSLKTLIANESQIQSYVNQQSRQNEISISSAIEQEAFERRMNLFDYNEGGSKNATFAAEIASIPSLEGKIEYGLTELAKIRKEANTIIEKEVDGKTQKAKKTILTNPELRQVEGQVRSMIAQSVSSELINSFTDNNQLDSVKLRDIVSAMTNNIAQGKPFDVTKIRGYKDFSPKQKKAVETIVPSLTKGRAVGPGGQEISEGGQTNLALSTRKAIATHIKSEINNANQLAGELVAQKKAEVFANNVTQGVFMTNSPANSKAADEYILAVASNIPGLQGKSVKQILMSKEFAEPNSEIQKVFTNLLQKNGIVSQETKELIFQVRDGLITGPPAQMFLDYIVKGTTLIAEKTDDGAIRYRPYNVFRVDKELHEAVLDIQEAYKISQITGGTLNIARVLQNQREYVNSQSYKDKLKEVVNSSPLTKDVDSYADAVKKIRDEIASEDVVIAAGGNGSMFHELLMKAVPHYIFQNKNADIKIKDITRYAVSTMDTFFGPTEDYVIDPVAVSIDGQVRSSMALNRIFPNDETKESWLNYVQEKLELYGQYDIRSGNRDGIQGAGGRGGDVISRSVIGIVSAISQIAGGSPQLDTSGAKKAWLVPQQFTSTDQFSDIDKHNVTFFLTEGISSELSFIASDKELATVSFEEFRHWQETGEFLKKEDK